MIDFGDQITLALDVVEGLPEVGRDYRSRFGAVVLDEYQDTNVAQADLIAGAFGDGLPVTAVGDPDQNIYAWRGASLFNLLEFPEQFRARRRLAGRAAARCTRTSARARASSRAADTVIAPIPAGAAARPRQDARPVPAERRRPGGGAPGSPTSGPRRGGSPRASAALHEEDPRRNPWSSFAVLSRKSRLFVPLQEAFGERGIPVEIVGSGRAC